MEPSGTKYIRLTNPVPFLAEEEEVWVFPEKNNRSPYVVEIKLIYLKDGKTK